MEICLWHLCNNPVEQSNPSGSKKKFCSRRCANRYRVTKRRKQLKEKAVAYKGGKCEKCGYFKYIEALQFHHKDPTQKDFGLAAEGMTRSWAAVQAEVDKCMLLCSLCHTELHIELRLEVT